MTSKLDPEVDPARLDAAASVPPGARGAALAQRFLTELYAAGDEDAVAAAVHGVVMLWLDERVIAEDDPDLEAATATLARLAAKMRHGRRARGLSPAVVDPANGPDGAALDDPAAPGEFWVQGDAVRLAGATADDAVARYRAAVATGALGVAHGRACDAVAARRLARDLADRRAAAALGAVPRETRSARAVEMLRTLHGLVTERVVVRRTRAGADEATAWDAAIGDLAAAEAYSAVACEAARGLRELGVDVGGDGMPGAVAARERVPGGDRDG